MEVARTAKRWLVQGTIILGELMKVNGGFSHAGETTWHGHRVPSEQPPQKQESL
jgi:hypothetical protein